jgi:hypothetical protein
MATRIEVRTGATGYRDQLDRVRRYLDRVRAQESPRYVIDYQDDVWSFFQNCWHLKDWVKHDPLIPERQKHQIKLAVEASRVLAVANDIANGTKHLELYDPRAPAEYAHTRLNTTDAVSQVECVILVDGIHMNASVVAEECLSEWISILAAEGLPTDPIGT